LPKIRQKKNASICDLTSIILALIFASRFSRVRARIPGDLAFLLSQPSHNGAKNGDLRFSHTISKIMTQNTSREPYFGVLHAIERSLS